jgi:uncharacterized damage-inducible protein DinB
MYNKVCFKAREVWGEGGHNRQLQASTLCSAGFEGGARMSVESVRSFFAYGRWANRRLLEAAGELSADELDFDLRGSFASIKGTLRHLLWGERSWLRFWREDDFGPDLSPADIPDLPSIVDSWAALEKEQDVFARELSEEKLRSPRRVDDDSYVLEELIQHCSNHSTHHRGQVVLMLRQLGRTPPDTGFRQFLAANR